MRCIQLPEGYSSTRSPIPPARLESALLSRIDGHPACEAGIGGNGTRMRRSCGATKWMGSKWMGSLGAALALLLLGGTAHGATLRVADAAPTLAETRPQIDPAIAGHASDEMMPMFSRHGRFPDAGLRMLAESFVQLGPVGAGARPAPLRHRSLSARRQLRRGTEEI